FSKLKFLAETAKIELSEYNKTSIVIENIGTDDEGQEIFMPSLHPKENWEKTKRWDIFDGLIKVGIDEEKNMALAPTHEEVIAPLVKDYVSSYKDLPKYVYQFQNKFRGEKRAKSGLLRGREFIMKDLYSFHENQEDLDNYYKKVTQAYKNIFNRSGIGESTYFTYASGGTFAKYSHEFQTLTSAGEDIIFVCSKCKIAINKEIIADLEHKCPECGNKDLKEEKAVEVGNIFKMGTRYSEPFDLYYTDKTGNKNLMIMGCYGIGLQRLMGTIVEIYNDSKGIIWPESVAPFNVHLISIDKNEEAEKVYQELKANGVEVLFDDRDMRAGEKFAESDLIGVPKRLVISSKSLLAGGYELKERSKMESRIINSKDLIKEIIGK
ncbi:MAG: aminoacyl--tRNA ligase-related protein, partial [Candidatus Staskawiczbacteria bacterium]